MDISEDILFTLGQRNKYFRDKVYDLCTRSEYQVHSDTSSIPGDGRRVAVLKGWDDYRESQLVPLVREAVDSIATVAERIPDGSAKHSVDLVRERVITSVIEPAMERTRNWFRWASDGEPNIRSSGWTPERHAQWQPAVWLDPNQQERARAAEIKQRRHDRGRVDIAQRVNQCGGAGLTKEAGVTLRRIDQIKAHIESGSTGFITEKEAELYGRLGHVLEQALMIRVLPNIHHNGTAQASSVTVLANGGPVSGSDTVSAKLTRNRKANPRRQAFIALKQERPGLQQAEYCHLMDDKARGNPELRVEKQWPKDCVGHTGPKTWLYFLSNETTSSKVKSFITRC